MNKHKSAKKNSVASLITRSRFVMRTEFFDVKAALHQSSAPCLPIEADAMPELQQDRCKKNRLVIAIPRRIGSAPVRNRCRRRIRELVRTMGLADLPCDLIFFVRTSCADVPIAALRALLEKVRKKIEKLSFLLQ